MKLKIENKEELNVDKFEIVKKALKSLRSYGPNSYAILTDGFGNYIQVGGGIFTCFVEKYDVCEKKSIELYTKNLQLILKMVQF
jgi:hypothetical protein